uniref:NADH dehydrogenase subunit 6 n=1 Tax=Paranaspides williamsi TaxID=2231316 RepID=UPI002A833E9C|nr:NADH dehydrogenase subunit 6 [Paranaspides williamsi]WOR81145.1 NADH dehydrogenase subunit 6 [Paranaspides williamsi]
MFFLLFSFLLTFFMSVIFLMTNHPLSMGLALLFQTCFICMTSGAMNLTFWFSYILFLIFLGGMLVLFIYVASLASNEMFKMSFSLFSFILLFSISLLLVFWFLDFLLFHINMLNPQYFFSNYSCQSPNQSLLSYAYSPYIMFCTLFMVFYLLLTLILAVKITNNFQGPLRFYS